MTIDKNDLEGLINRVQSFDKHDLDQVLYLKEGVNRPADLFFLGGSITRKLFNEITPNPERYEAVGTKPLLNALTETRRLEIREPEFPFPEKTERLMDLSAGIKEQQQTRKPSGKVHSKKEQQAPVVFMRKAHHR